MILLQLIVAVAALAAMATGYGFVVLSAPLLALMLPPHKVVPLTVALGWVLVTVLLARPSVWNAVDRPLTARITVTGALGIPVGVLLLHVMDPATLRIVLGVVCAALALAGLARLTLPVQRPLTVYVTGFVCGMLSGSVGLAGPPVVLYLTSSRASKATFRGTAAAVNWLLASITLIQLALFRQLPPDLGGHVLSFLPALAIGGVLGVAVFPIFSSQRFRQMALGLAAVSGVVAAATATLRSLP
ncbi:MAG: sulfite exporter TauE/SafE family protein [Chloroflexota bacterium]